MIGRMGGIGGIGKKMAIIPIASTLILYKILTQIFYNIIVKKL